MTLPQLHREIHFLEASLGKSKKEVERKEKQLRKLNEKVTQLKNQEKIAQMNSKEDAYNEHNDLDSY